MENVLHSNDELVFHDENGLARKRANAVWLIAVGLRA
jgi:hypothetical protein